MRRMRGRMVMRRPGGFEVDHEQLDHLDEEDEEKDKSNCDQIWSLSVFSITLAMILSIAVFVRHWDCCLFKSFCVCYYPCF